MTVPEPPKPEPTPTPPGGDTTSSGGGSSSSGGPSAPAVDPIIAQKVSAFGSVYMQLWGEPATKAYLEQAAHQGLNVWEFSLQERMKPAWTQTKAFKDQLASRVDLLKQIGLT